MELRKICKWYVIAGTLVIWAIKFGIRPFLPVEQPATFVLGIAPNLLGSFLIPFGAVWFFGNRYFLLARIFHIHSAASLRAVCLTGLGLLIINEYLQLIPVFGRTFDPYDILFSAIGLSVSYLVFSQKLARYNSYTGAE
jgi:hypothetical protein